MDKFSPPRITRDGLVQYPTAIQVVALAASEDPQTHREQVLAQYILNTQDKKASR